MFGLNFKNPIGLAAGFDKNAQVVCALAKFGFGFIECGSVTPRPQLGNPKPRIFRLAKKQAVINALGFNNLGEEVFRKNLAKIDQKDFILGVNLGKNKDSVGFDDYLKLLAEFYVSADYITINISSPNTEKLRELQQREQLNELLKVLTNLKTKLKKIHKKRTPILIKVAPDLTIKEQKQIAELALDFRLDGIIISNTSINLRKQLSKLEQGGLSGKPLLEQSNLVLKNFYQFTEGKIPLIGVGGIASAADAYQKIKLGASLVQIYTAFIYQGFGLVEKIKAELSEMVKLDGFKNISEAIGVDAKKR